MQHKWCHDKFSISRGREEKPRRFQISSEAWDGFPAAIEAHLGGRVDHGAIRKEFGSAGGVEARRYAPPRLLSSEKYWVSGTPDEDRVGMSRIERFNWTLRTGLRRFVRLSNGFSRKRENLDAAVSTFIAYYNFFKFHKSIRMTPAMKAGIVPRAVVHRGPPPGGRRAKQSRRYGRGGVSNFTTSDGESSGHGEESSGAGWKSGPEARYDGSRAICT
jgi:hypothetical protein